MLKFFDDGGNVMFIGDIDTSKAFRVLANKMGIQISPIVSQTPFFRLFQGSAVIDYKNHYS